MNNNILKLLKEKPIVIPKVLFSNYKKLDITSDELLVIVTIMSYGDKVIYDPEMFAGDMNISKHEVMKNINNLIDKNIVSLVIDKANRKATEYISLDTLYDKLYNIVIGTENKEDIDNSIFGIFEGELGRMMSPMEYEKIKEWITNGNSNELIICALNEAVLNGVSNLNYIDSILNSWKKKGYKTKSDIKKDKDMYRKKKSDTDIFDTDWLNE